MAAPGSEFHLGIIGGCLSHQPGVPLSQLYHRQISKNIFAATGVHLRVHLARYSDGEYRERLDELLGKRSLDGILLHMRVLVGRKADLLVGYSTNGMRNYVLHPFLIDRRHCRWDEVEASGFKHCRQVLQRRIPHIANPSGDRFDQPPLSTRLLGLRLDDLNRILGRVVGLDEWAIQDELELLDDVHRACIERAIPLAVLGPTPVPASLSLGRFCSKMNERYKTTLPQRGIPFCPFETSFDEQKTELVKRDGLHMTLAGHRFAANLLSPTIARWISEAAPRP